MTKPLPSTFVAVGLSANPSSPLVRELHDGHREAILSHLIALGSEDRHLRFGSPTSNSVIDRYVTNLDFSRDAMFGVFSSALDLVGFAHLAYLPAARGDIRTAEFGVSVLPEDRHRGLGAALLERAAMHARNTQITTLFVHCLAKNKAMMHLAHKLGMRVKFADGDADAYLILPPANVQSILNEATQEQMADLDYAVKVNLKQSKQMWRWFFGVPNRS